MTYRPSFAEIDLNVIRNNYQLSCQQAPASKQLAVIKANAYGHGAVQVAKQLEDIAPAFAVAFIDEALALREAGIRSPILIMEGFFRAQELSLASEKGFWLMLHSPEQIEMLEKTPLPSPLNCWLKVDTGMHRLGILPEHVPAILERLTKRGKLAQSPVLATHMANAEEMNNPLNQRQIDRLRQLGKDTNSPLSQANSAALMQLPASHSNWNRPGIMLYGCSPLVQRSEQIGLQPAMSVYSEIIAIRELKKGDAVGYGGCWQARKPSRIATLAIGYGDGYPRSTDSQCEVFLHGQRATVAGSVSMDMLGVDISHIPEARVGDKVELWGNNIPVTELARRVNTLSYELLTRVNQRLPKHFVD
ncbi:alanine racemase [Lacimicrobium alkaliphilum]|uniref:Alanine racemase n=1 Tax=Lacimicrobium alkaliphilum TaxID=1526571 RepID=A0ABQ1RPB7_9ALTE|nr:alanine racemase [Lacimicrobium alkaliphilum]GGD75007.1 alanine racemase, biosynthetic [Lacimicrobium alkaliphilum]